MAKSVDLKLNIKPVAKLKGLLDECVGAADRLGDAMSRINPDLMAAYKDIGPDPLVSDMRTAVAICENEDHVTSMIGKAWLKALIQHRCSVVGMSDPFMSQEATQISTDNKVEIKVSRDAAVNNSINSKGGNEVNISFVDPSPEEDKGPVVTDTWGPWVHPINGDWTELHQRSDASDSALANADWWKGCAEPYGNGADGIEQRANAWTTVCHTITAINPAWRAGHKKAVDAAVEFIQQMSDPDFKEVAKSEVKNGREMVAEGIGSIVMDETAEACFRLVINNLDKPAMVEALNKHFGFSLPIPGEPVKELKPKMLKSAGFQVQLSDGHWTYSMPGKPMDYYDAHGIRTREIFAVEE